MSEQRPESPPENDVVSLLLQQHQMIRALCDEVTAATATSRQEPFQRLLRLMAVHEAVEEEIVHPFVRRRVQGTTAMVEDRLQEERAAKEMLVQLDSMGPTAAGFMPLFGQFRTAVLAHSDKEESSEFAGLREQTRPAELRAMTAAAKVAAALAPTHPHPGVESATGNLLVGTPLAMIDRARDLIRHALGPKAGSSAPNGHGETPAASGTKNKEIVRRLNEAFDAADEPAIRALFTTDFVAHGMPPGVSGDANGWVQLASQLKAALYDNQTVIEDMIAEDDKVASRFTARGTHTGELFGMSPTNRTLTVTGIEIYQLSGGQVAEYWAEVNITGTFLPCQAFARALVEAGRTGAIVNVASMSGLVVNVPQPQAAYNASKAAVSMLTASLAIEWLPLGIRVNAIAPGYFASDMTKAVSTQEPEMVAEWMRRTPAGRMGRPEELGPFGELSVQ